MKIKQIEPYTVLSKQGFLDMVAEQSECPTVYGLDVNYKECSSDKCQSCWESALDYNFIEFKK